jgi:hypothetical protein
MTLAGPPPPARGTMPGAPESAALAAAPLMLHRHHS